MRAPKLPAVSAVLLAVTLGVSGLKAADDYSKDQPGSADHPALKRIEGSVIVWFEKKAFSEQCVALAKVAFDGESGEIVPFKQAIVEGPQTRILYRAPNDAAPLEVLRQYQADLKASGFENLFEGKGGHDSTLDDGNNQFLQQVYQKHGLPDQIYNAISLGGDYRYAAFRKSTDAGDTYITIFAEGDSEYSAFGAENGQALVLVTVTETKGMADRMVKVSASEMEKSLSQSGRIALYGIYFDSDRSEVKPDSKEALTEIASLMKSNGALKVLIVGHTDSIGGFDANKALSERRAKAVVAALSSQYGVESQRMSPTGVSFAAPLESNESEAGRAKNRRVELVKIVEK